MLRLLIVAIISISLPLFASGSVEEPRIGVAVYDFQDSYITEVRNAITACSEGGIPVTIVDAEGRQQRQNEQIERDRPPCPFCCLFFLHSTPLI